MPMKLFSVVLIVVLFTHTECFEAEEHRNYYLVPEDCGTGNMDRIIGGSRAILGQYPWLARVGYNLRDCSTTVLYRCGGFLINENYVVTAAHCVTDLPSLTCPVTKHAVDFQLAAVALGENTVNTSIDCENGECADPIQEFVPEEVIPHKYYNIPKFANDIALIRLHKPAKLSNWVSPLCLPRGKLMYMDFAGQYGEVAGWGTFDVKSPNSSNELLYVKVPILTMQSCKSAYIKNFEMNIERQLCAGGDAGRDSCGGDSGGPLMSIQAYHSPPRYYGIGVVSFGAKKCGDANKPAIYTKVGNYVEWILDSIRP